MAKEKAAHMGGGRKGEKNNGADYDSNIGDSWYGSGSGVFDYEKTCRKLGGSFNFFA